MISKKAQMRISEAVTNLTLPKGFPTFIKRGLFEHVYIYIYVRGTFWVHFTYITCMRNLIYLPINFFNFFNFWGSLREINEIKEIN